jgi:hypothetical protein
MILTCGDLGDLPELIYHTTDLVLVNCNPVDMETFPLNLLYSGRRLMGSLWDREKLIPIAD